MTPIFLTGDCRGKWNLQRLKANNWGRISVRDWPPKPYKGEPWGIDSGAYRDWVSGKKTDWERYADRASQAAEMHGCYIAVLPDVVAGGIASLEFSLTWMSKLPDMPWYLPVQDGMTVRSVMNWIAGNLPTGLFLGGTTPFKNTAPIWRDLSHELGILFHYGRAGTKHKIRHALKTGVDSMDSAFPLWTKERWKFTELCLKGEAPQLELIE